VRKAMTILSVMALGVAGTAWAEETKGDRESKVARAMAVAEIDFDLHRARLGLVGSSLSESPAKPEAANPTAVVARAMAVAEIDFDLHRAHLGLAGSSLLSETHAKPGTARPAAVAGPTERTASPLEWPAAPAAISEPRQ
jgi:hypothetical protein